VTALVALGTCLLAGTGGVGDRSFLSAELHARAGSVAAPFATRAIPEVRSEFQAYSIIGCIRLMLPPWQFGVRLPFATSSVEQPAGSYVADYTFGNPEVFVERGVFTSPLGSEEGLRWRSSLRLAVGMPVAGHGPAESWVKNRVLAASDAVEGWREPELFQPGILPIVPGMFTQLEGASWNATGALKLPVLIRTSRASYPSEVSVGSGLMPVLSLGGAWHARHWLTLGASTSATWLAVQPVDPLRDVGRSGRVQLTVVPYVQFRLPFVFVRLDLLAATGGPLDGTFSVGGSVGVQAP
jgi:hypothetical protein